MLELRDMTKIYNAGTVTELTLFDRFNLTVGAVCWVVVCAAVFLFSVIYFYRLFKFF